MLALHYIDEQVVDIPIEITSQAHTFMGLVVSFLLVSRVNIALARYNTARECLGQMCRSTRELVQNACVLSSDVAENHDEQARSWRNEVAYRVILLLRTAVAVVGYRTSGEPAWAVNELNGEEYEDIKNSIFMASSTKDVVTNKYAASHVQGTWQETMRVPIRVAYLLRKSVRSQNQRLAKPLVFAAENKLYGCVDNFMSGYYGIRKFLTTPVPFPLVQMSRTFMFLFVFTVPFVMLSDRSNIIAHCFAVFLLTYGFMGLEAVAIELDDPFGDDENDFDAMYVILLESLLVRFSACIGKILA